MTWLDLTDMIKRCSVVRLTSETLPRTDKSFSPRDAIVMKRLSLSTRLDVTGEAQPSALLSRSVNQSRSSRASFARKYIHTYNHARAGSTQSLSKYYRVAVFENIDITTSRGHMDIANGEFSNAKPMCYDESDAGLWLSEITIAAYIRQLQ